MTAEQRNETKEILPVILAATALFHLINKEIEPEITKEREAYERLFGKRQTEFNQGFSFDLDKYQNFSTVRIGKIEKEFDSDSIDASFMAGMSKAESDSRSKADLAALKS